MEPRFGDYLPVEIYKVLKEVGFNGDPGNYIYVYLSNPMNTVMLSHFDFVKSRCDLCRFNNSKQRMSGLYELKFKDSIGNCSLCILYFNMDYLSGRQHQNFCGLLIQKSYQEQSFKTLANLYIKYGGCREPETTVRDLSWDRIFLNKDLKDELKKDFESFLKSREFYNKELKLPWKRGYMFYGPPGNGKTLLIKTLAKVYDLHTYDMKCACRNGELFIEEHRTMDPFKSIHDYVYPEDIKPTIYYIEDIDKFTTGTGTEDAATVKLHNLVKGLDGVVDIDDVIVIATTNEMNSLCEALANRPGRFDVIREIGHPDVKAIKSLFKYYEFEVIDDLVCSMVEDKFTMAYAEEFVKVAKTRYYKINLNSDELNNLYNEIKNHIKKFERNFKDINSNVGFREHYITDANGAD